MIILGMKIVVVVVVVVVVVEEVVVVAGRTSALRSPGRWRSRLCPSRPATNSHFHGTYLYIYIYIS